MRGTTRDYLLRLPLRVIAADCSSRRSILLKPRQRSLRTFGSFSGPRAHLHLHIGDRSREFAGFESTCCEARRASP